MSRLPSFVLSASQCIPPSISRSSLPSSFLSSRRTASSFLSTPLVARGVQKMGYNSAKMTAQTNRNLTEISSASSDASDSPAYQGEILCNRALNMAKIKAVGFDMDYTLAMYHSEKVESMAANMALKKLVHQLGYPKQLLELKYDHSRFIRGLIIDKEAGNIIKLDRHKYVKRAFHGDKSLSKEKRAELYDIVTHSDGGFARSRFAALDAMYSLPDAFLFSSLVAYKDANPGSISQDYTRIYKDVRRSVDMCHRDGSLKDRISQSPEEYIQQDPRIILTLRKLRRSGRKVFLLTNSLWDYTDVVMRYLYGDNPGNWIDLFDVIVTGSSKPAFMLNTSLPMYRCDHTNGMLSNTEGVYNETPEDYLARGKCFQGGSFVHLHDLLGVANGTQVLYVGDHIFSDVLRSKRTLGWRTMLVIPEIEHEVNILYHPDTRALIDEINRLHDARDELDEWVDRLENDIADLQDGSVKESENSKLGRESVIGNGNSANGNGNYKASSDVACNLRDLEEELESARTAAQDIRSKISAKVEEHHCLFHPTWGQLFKTGLQNSRFAEQVESYACLYTSCVSNISFVSPEMYWRSMNDLMPHDRLTMSPMHRVLAKRALESSGSE